MPRFVSSSIRYAAGGDVAEKQTHRVCLRRCPSQALAAGLRSGSGMMVDEVAYSERIPRVRCSIFVVEIERLDCSEVFGACLAGYTTLI